jgi:hypothetical protein
MENRIGKQFLPGGWHQWEWGGHKERLWESEYGSTESLNASTIQKDKIEKLDLIKIFCFIKNTSMNLFKVHCTHEWNYHNEIPSC